jgi:hypothetical protein
MLSSSDARRIKTQLLVWWALWGMMLAGLAIFFLSFEPPSPTDQAIGDQSVTGLAGLVPLFISIVLRWLVLPRYTGSSGAQIVFFVGVALSELGGILGVWLGGPYREHLFLLGLLGVGQFAPFYARRLFRHSTVPGVITHR